MQESLPGKTERRKARNASIFEGSLVSAAVVQSFKMLNPVVMAKNPVMFITEVGAVLTTAITVYDASLNKPGLIYNLAVLLVLWVTVLFSNFAESLAEARGKAQADSLKRTRQNTAANKFRDGYRQRWHAD